MAIMDIRGQRFNKLVALIHSHNHQKNAYWYFVCDCGLVTIAAAHSVKRGGTQSCGCHRREVSKEYNTKHGEAGPGTASRLYRIWSQMKRRCDLPTVRAYPRYGGRGIKVCKDWSESFEVFRDWALENGYSEKLTIDRRDNDGDYEPNNCRWGTHKIQANNRRTNKNVQYKGERYTVSELADKFNLPIGSLGYRLLKGMSPEEAVEYLTKQQINEVA